MDMAISFPEDKTTPAMRLGRMPIGVCIKLLTYEIGEVINSAQTPTGRAS
jgi:hypothetical protein